MAGFWPPKETQHINELRERVAVLEHRTQGLDELRLQLAEALRRNEFLDDMVGRLNEALGGALDRLNMLEAQKTERPRSHFSKGVSPAAKAAENKP